MDSTPPWATRCSCAIRRPAIIVRSTGPSTRGSRFPESGSKHRLQKAAFSKGEVIDADKVAYFRGDAADRRRAEGRPSAAAGRPAATGDRVRFAGIRDPGGAAGG